MINFSRETEVKLLELLEKELGLFERMRELTEEQSELLAVDAMEDLESSLDGRQGLIEKINGLHQESDSLMQSYALFSGSGGGDRIEAVETLLARINEEIAKCSGLNEENTNAAKEKAEEYIRRIGKLSLSRKSLGAYALNVPNSPELFDKKT